MYGIKETIELMQAGVAIKSAVETAKANDGKIDLLTDWPGFAAALPALFSAVQGGNQIPKELGDLDEEEIQQLRAKFGEIVDNESWGKIFAGLATVASGIAELV